MSYKTKQPDEYIVVERREPIGEVRISADGEGSAIQEALKLSGQYIDENLGAGGMNIEFNAFGRLFRVGVEPIAHSEEEKY